MGIELAGLDRKSKQALIRESALRSSTLDLVKHICFKGDTYLVVLYL
jgi:hypothetical protein